METRFSYTIVGLFVLVLSVVCIIGALWLSVGLESSSRHRYLVLMNESVSGLSPKAPVKYNGVDVGTVTSITLSKDNPEQVRLILDIDDSVPISVDTRAELNSQGLTGIAYIELMGGKVGSPALKAEPGEEYPVIKTEPSLMFRLDGALNHLSDNLDTITTGLTSILNKNNTEAVSDILKNLKHVSQNLSDNSDELDSIIKNADITMKNSAEASQQFPEVIDNINSSAHSVEQFTKKLTQVGEEAEETFANTKAAAQTINEDILPQASDVLYDFKQVLNNVKRLSNELADQPSMLIRGKHEPAPGPGE